LAIDNLYAASQPGESLYSLATAAPPNPQAVFGDPASFGTPNDPKVGKAIGGSFPLDRAKNANELMPGWIVN
jgi:hypothetical protein